MSAAPVQQSTINHCNEKQNIQQNFKLLQQEWSCPQWKGLLPLLLLFTSPVITCFYLVLLLIYMLSEDIKRELLVLIPCIPAVIIAVGLHSYMLCRCSYTSLHLPTLIYSFLQASTFCRNLMLPTNVYNLSLFTGLLLIVSNKTSPVVDKEL
jgi:hypothetical protein